MNLNICHSRVGGNPFQGASAPIWFLYSLPRVAMDPRLRGDDKM